MKYQLSLYKLLALIMILERGFYADITSSTCQIWRTIHMLLMILFDCLIIDDQGQFRIKFLIPWDTKKYSIVLLAARK